MALPPQRPRVCDRRCPRQTGWGQASAASNRIGRSRRRRKPSRSRPLIRDTSVSRLRKESRIFVQCGAHRAQARRVYAEDGSSVDSPVVLVDRIDCRNRRTARGNERSQVMSLWKRRGLVLLQLGGRKSVGSRMQAAKPGSRWRARARGLVKTRLSGHSSTEGALRRGSRTPLTRSRRKRPSRIRRVSARPDAMTEGVRG